MSKLVCVGLLLLFAAVGDARVQIRFNHSFVEADEGSPDFSFRLLVLGVFEKNFSVNINYESISASKGLDYFPIENEAHFTVGQIESSSVRVLITEDNAWEGMEMFRVSFDIPEGVDAEKGLPNSMQVGIRDDDSVLVSFDSPDITIKEGEGDVVLRLKSRHPYTVPFSVFVTCLEVEPVEAKGGVRGRDNPVADYIVQENTVYFNDTGRESSLSSSITVTIVDDLFSESQESFICIILKPFDSTGGIAVENPDTITISIVDDDFLWVQFDRLQFGGSEGGTATLQLRADGEFSDSFAASIFVYNLQGIVHKAEPNVDFLAPRQMIGKGIVNFEPNSPLGKLSTPLVIPLYNDGIVEYTEMFGVECAIEPDMEQMRTLNIAKRGRGATVVIIDRDEMLVRFSQPNFTASESEDQAEVTLEVVVPHSNISGEYVPAEHSIEFDVNLKTLDGSAIAGSDYTSKEGRVTFYPGMSTSTIFYVDLRNDDMLEGPEGFKIQLEVENAWTSKVKVLQPETDVTILDDDFAKISFEMSKYETVEGSVLRVYLVSDRVFQDNQRITIDILNDTAFVTEDFELLTPSVVIRAGERKSNVVRVRIVDNDVVEGVETFMLAVNIPRKAARNGASYGEPRMVTVTVEDDDKVTVGFPDPGENKTVNYTVGEGDGTYEVDVTVVHGEVFAPFNVTLRAVPVTRDSDNGKTAKEWTDFFVDGETNVLMFGVGDMRSSLAVIRIIDDYLCEGSEKFDLVVEIDSETAEKVQLSDFNKLPITIIDNEGPCEQPDVPKVVSFDTDFIRRLESDEAIKIQVIRLGKLDTPLKVMLRTEILTADEGTDFDLLEKEVIFSNQDSVFEVKEVRLMLYNDGMKESPEGFRIILDAPEGTEYQQRDISVVIDDNQ